MFNTRTEKAQARSLHVFGKGGSTFSVEVVREFADAVTDDGVVIYRRMTGVRIEGDLPTTIKKCVEACLRRGAYAEAQNWIEGYAEALD